MSTLVAAVILAGPAEPAEVEGDGSLGGIAVSQVTSLEAVLKSRIAIARRRESDGDEGENEEHQR